MDIVDHSTFPALKREPDFSPGVGFQTTFDKSKDQGASFDMDFSSFLGGCGGEQGTPGKYYFILYGIA